ACARRADVVFRLYLLLVHVRIGSAARFRSILEQLAFSRGSLRGSGRRFFNVFYVPSARLYSAGMYLLPHLRHHNVPSSVRRDLALSSHPPLRGTFQYCTLMSKRPILTHSSVAGHYLNRVRLQRGDGIVDVVQDRQTAEIGEEFE